MGTMTFHSDDPDQQSTDVVNPSSADAYKLERMLRLPAYWNANDPLHHRAVSDVRALSARLYGDADAPSGSMPTMSFDTVTGEPIEREFAAPMVATGEGQPDEFIEV
jgi:hypothetical protein